MAHTLQRLTLYGLISSLERDLRDIIVEQIGIEIGLEKLLPDALEKKALERLRKDDISGSADPKDLVEYLDLAEEVQTIRSLDHKLDESRKKYLRKYYQYIEGIIPVRNRVMHSRPLEFGDYSRVVDLCRDLVKSNGSFWANLRATKRHLEKDPEYFAGIEIPEPGSDGTKLLHNLPHTEFDDTGFIGREKELAELRRALQGSYPVVTVVGEGGLGKTALALKACYDLLDETDVDLDAIVWTTAKTTKLTANEIHVIEGAISSSLGIVESAASYLGRQNRDDPLVDLLMHLENNKVLLVIDNLETVIDNNIRDLVKRVPSGSRILLTTRIGLGAYDFPIPLDSLPLKEAAFYFRWAAKAWGLKDYAQANNSVVEDYCTRLQKNPLYIKSFLQSVRVGHRPSALVANPTTFLEFCLQNVFTALSTDAKSVAGALASVSGSQTVATLTFFTDLESFRVQSALTILITSNIVSAERGRSSDDEDRYVLSDLARMYIQRFIRPPIEEQRTLIRKQNVLRSAQEEYLSRVGSDIFDINTVFVRDKDDYIVASYLTKVIEHMFKDRISEAEALWRRARDLSPNYFEVHRVRALLDIKAEDYFAAEAAYESAVSLAPNRAPLRLWFAGFLSRQLGDHERALQQLYKAQEISPDTALVQIEIARMLQYQKRFSESGEILRSVSNIDQQSARLRRVHLDLLVQNDLRRAEYEIQRGDYISSISCLEAACGILEGAPEYLIDDRTIRNVRKIDRIFPALERATKGLPQEERLYLVWTKLYGWTTKQNPSRNSPMKLANSPNGQELTHGSSFLGRIARMNASFGFIRSNSGVDVFFHKTDCKEGSNFNSLDVGDPVRAVFVVNGEKTRAREVELYSGLM